jgi:hypothetical protein
VRVRSTERTAEQPRRGVGRVTHVGPPAEQPGRPTRAEEGPPEERALRAPERDREPEAPPDEPVAEDGRQARSAREERPEGPERPEKPEPPERRERPKRPSRSAPEGAGKRRPASPKSRGLDTPVERLRNREPRGE